MIKFKYSIFFIVGIFLLVYLLVEYFGLSWFNLSFDYFQEKKIVFFNKIANHYVLSIFLMIVLYSFITAFSIPPAPTIFNIFFGFVYGTYLGALFSAIGATIGGIIIFFISRETLVNWVQIKYYDKFKYFNEDFKENGVFYILSIRFIPVLPFFLVNIFCGITKIKLKDFIWTTFIGIFPSTLIYSYTGKELNNIKNINNIFTYNNILILISLAILTILPIFVKKIREKNEFK